MCQDACVSTIRDRVVVNDSILAEHGCKVKIINSNPRVNQFIMAKWQQFFIFCSGIDSTLLEKTPTDTNKYIVIGIIKACTHQCLLVTNQIIKRKKGTNFPKKVYTKD